MMRRDLERHGSNIFILRFTFFLRIPFLTKVSFTGLFLVSGSFCLGRAFFVIFVLFLLLRTIRNEMSKFFAPKIRLVGSSSWFIFALVLSITPEVALSKDSSKVLDKQSHLLIIKLIIFIIARFFILG